MFILWLFPYFPSPVVDISFGCSTSAFTYITCDINTFNVSINTACICFFKLCNHGYIITYIHSNILHYFAASIEYSSVAL
jgi:hypothetical protein